MQIGIDARFFGPKGKGLGRYTQKLIEELEKVDKQNQYIVFLRRSNWNLYEPGSQNFKKVLADYRWYSLAEQIFMPFKIRAEKIDLMHFPHFNIPVFYFGKFVVTIHDLILRHFSTRRASTLGVVKYWLKNFAYRTVINLAVKKAKKIIAVSDYVKNDIIDCFKISSEKVVVTYEGVPQRFYDLEGVVPSYKKYGISEPYLIYVGNAYPHKNLEKLIEGFRILAQENGNLKLALVGEIDYFYKRLERYLQKKFPELKDKVIFTDFVDDNELISIYQHASVYVFPSLCEGFGLPPLEAITYGVPVVCSNSTCLPEILGEAAVYFNAHDTADIAEKIKLVLNDEALRSKLIASGFEQIKKYSWRKMAEETLLIYQNNL